MDVFSGDPIDYQYYHSMFREVAKKRITDPVRRLTRLIKHRWQSEGYDKMLHPLVTTEWLSNNNDAATPKAW